MSTWDSYPDNYRSAEVQRILAAVRSGESVSVLGLSGAGKSNLLGFLAYRVSWSGQFLLVDCNQLFSPTPVALLQLVTHALAGNAPVEKPPEGLLEDLSLALGRFSTAICLLMDRFDIFTGTDALTIANVLRTLRDRYKYQLTYVFATRRPLDPTTELAELVFANTFWLGPLQPSDTVWNIQRYAARKGLSWLESEDQVIQALTWGYPAFVRAVSEAYASGCLLETSALLEHPIVQRRIVEFWKDQPSSEMLEASGLAGHPFLDQKTTPLPTAGDLAFDHSQLTAKEHLLFVYFQDHPEVVCEKDTLIQAVWPEDQVFEAGIRDDSLAQLVRRLRKKIEPDPTTPSRILTVPGRGYRYHPPS